LKSADFDTGFSETPITPVTVEQDGDWDWLSDGAGG